MPGTYKYMYRKRGCERGGLTLQLEGSQKRRHPKSSLLHFTLLYSAQIQQRGFCFYLLVLVCVCVFAHKGWRTGPPQFGPEYPRYAGHARLFESLKNKSRTKQVRNLDTNPLPTKKSHHPHLAPRAPRVVKQPCEKHMKTDVDFMRPGPKVGNYIRPHMGPAGAQGAHRLRAQASSVL